eukprot:jgi/Psemu1/69933/estExt_Genemark1.C_11880002
MGGFQLDIPAATVLSHRFEGTEMVTLHSLWEFCRNHPEVEKVVYLHSKGSMRNSTANEDLRRFLTRGALSEECATVDPTTCNVCSSRFSPLPHPHTSGNMWLATCDYVRKLLNPIGFEERMNAFTSNCTSKGRPSCDGRERFSAEHWIHSHPAVKPCDLYADPSFTWDYFGLPANGDFEIQLAPAPRFDLVTYIRWNQCTKRGVNVQHRLDEYWGLYQEKPDESWWGWKTLKTNDEWLPKTSKGADKWRRRDICWSAGASPNPTGVLTKQQMDKKRDYVVTPTSNSCPIGSRIEQGPVLGESTGGDLTPPDASGTKRRRVLVMTAVPRGKRHVIALWSQLECFTGGVDHVVLVSPIWSKELTTQIVDRAKVAIPRFRDGDVSLRTEYVVNDRYDVGLWCDAITSLETEDFDEFGLLNDSVFALRPFSGVFDALSNKNVSLSSLSYSYSPKNFEGEDGPQHFWLESVFRGFTREGMDIFRRHSCVPADHPFFCPEETENKGCIVNNFEHDLAIEYPCEKVYGIYPSDAPKSFLEKNRHRTWARNKPYWRALKTDANFPVAKVKESQLNQRNMMGNLAECTKHYNETLVNAMDFNLAIPRHKRPWVRLDRELQTDASSIMGLDSITYKNWKTSKFAATPFHQLTTEQQTFLESSLDCDARLWNSNRCGPAS